MNLLTEKSFDKFIKIAGLEETLNTPVTYFFHLPYWDVIKSFNKFGIDMELRKQYWNQRYETYIIVAKIPVTKFPILNKNHYPLSMLDMSHPISNITLVDGNIHYQIQLDKYGDKYEKVTEFNQAIKLTNKFAFQLSVLIQYYNQIQEINQKIEDEFEFFNRSEAK
ncbi:MAG: hypothetical protein ACOCRK_07820 [bacterium]